MDSRNAEIRIWTRESKDTHDYRELSSQRWKMFLYSSVYVPKIFLVNSRVVLGELIQFEVDPTSIPNPTRVALEVKYNDGNRCTFFWQRID